MDAEFVDSASSSSGQQEQRKARQLCRQVQRALNLAFADVGFSGLFVDDVSPAPDCGRLLVHVFIPADLSAADAIGALRRDTPRLRSEVAMAITRKRAPELFFVPVFTDGECDE